MGDTLGILDPRAREHGNADQARTPSLKSMQMQGAILDSNGMAGQTSRTSGAFLLTQAQTAHTLLDLASITRDGENSRRQIQKAFETFDSIEEYLAILEIDSELRMQIERARDELEARLYEFESRRVIVR